MANLQTKLAGSSEELNRFQNDNGVAVVRSIDLSREHLERL
jgi:hypothetical protein